MPDELAFWRAHRDQDQPNPWSESVRLLDDDEAPAMLDTGYLTDEERANPDIAANVRAMDETAALITWVAQDEDEGQAYGYWRGPNDLPLAEAPVVMLDNEGQFTLLAGTLTEALCSEYGQWDDEGYDGLAARCREHGLEVRAEDPIDLPEPDVSPTPAEHHVARYRELLAES